MAAHMTVGNSPLWRGLRWLVWGGAAGLLLVPLAAMQFTSEVNWTPGDFVLMGTILGLACGAYELAVRVARNNTYVVAFGIAVATALFTTWINLAVGIIGGEDNSANGLFFLVLATGLIGAMLAQLKALPMARAMEVTAVAQALLGVFAFVTMADHPEGFVLSGLFAAMWFTSAQLFRIAAQDRLAVP